MKKGLVLEGGAMRGLFTCGVLDVFMEQGITFDGMIGVSAGVCFGCNLKSKQPKRALRYNMKYCKDPRYASVRSLIKTGDIFNVDFCYHMIPEVLDPFDYKAFRENPMEFYATCTDVETGKAVYQKCEKGNGDDLTYFQASASMPLVSRIVEVGGKKLLDGGIADSIPIRFFEEKGYEKNVIILTQPKDYRKGPNKAMALVRRSLRKYPKMIEAVESRHIRYNNTLNYIEEEEKAGKVFVIRPPKKLEIGHICRNQNVIKETYEMGRLAALDCIQEMIQFME